MKTIKQIGLIAIAIIAIGIIACKSDEPTGETQEQPIDYITDNAGNQIPIYKANGVSDAEATTAANNIKTAYNRAELNPYRNILSFGIKKIYILAGDSDDLYSFDKATGILNMGSGWTLDNTMACLIYAVYPALTKYTLSFGTTENPCTVTIKSDDQFTADEWKTLCDKVVAAIERGYNKYEGAEGLTDIGNKDRFKDIFAWNISIFLLKSTIYDCEVKSGDRTTIYLKTSALGTVDIEPAVFALDSNQAYKHP